MTHKTNGGHKWRVYAAIIGLVMVTTILLDAVSVLTSYPTEAHRANARQLDVVNFDTIGNGDFAKIMESDEYKKVAESPESQYTNTATGSMLAVTAVASIALIGAVYYYLRKRRLTNKAVGMTVLLVSIGQLIPLVLAHFGTAAYLGTRMPGIESVLFALFIGIIFAPLIVLLFARIFEWQYNRKHSFVID